ncbi:hybrid sensor histidine kinase/response regulator transcription factor [Gelidibacter salicanalis]|uniref:histidine kinase n=1 Tax=Gelidibacter salicanalis TaxID=291193 RepID=A0A934NJK9_9FLAO|nr:hybrid sensor histidine kinase/response regulator transcription factor [Gelidibacter salicanalis]MBJ7881549.1 response regulator [Gelidibacter salicanalis]
MNNNKFYNIVILSFMLNKHLIVLLFTLFSINCLIAQEKNLRFSQKFNISDGLAHNGVTSMYEDSRGFLWFGTYDGISKYDGYEFRTYKNSIDEDFLTSNRVRSINEDNHGNLWIGTDEGITVFNFLSEKFTKIHLNKISGKKINGPIIRKILIDKESDLVLCLTEGYGVLVFTKDFEFLGQFKPSQKIYPNDVSFFDGIHLDETSFLFSTSSGLLLFDITDKTFKSILNNEINYANSIIAIDEKTLLVSLSKGVSMIKYDANLEAKTFKIVYEGLENYKFNDLLLDKQGNLWLSELNDGVFKIDDLELIRNKKQFELENFNDNLKILRGSFLMTTKENDCWFATFNKGVYKINNNINPFKSYNIKMDYKFGLRSNSVTHIAPIGQDHVYVSATLGGLALFNTKSGTFKPLPFNLPDKADLNVEAVYTDSKKNIYIYIVGESTIYRKKPGTDDFEKIPLKNLLSSTSPGIRSFTEDARGNIWIGAFNDVYKISINEVNKVVKVESLNDNPYFKNKKISLARRIYADPIFDFIWIGADSDGLFRITNKKDTVIEELVIDQFLKDKHNQFSISSNFVSSMIRLPNDDMWIGTEGGGICKVIDSDSNPKFIPFTEKNGLSNNVVKNILYDDEYNLWITTNIGLNKFNTRENKFRKFNSTDGLPFEDFWFAAEKLDNGTMILSGLDGFCYFNPKDIHTTEKLPKLEFENLKILNKIIVPGDTINGRVLLNRSLTYVDEIELTHNENAFSLDLTSLHFANNKNHFIKYKLLPINQDWIEVPSNQRTINYSGLRPDEYELIAIASNSLNEWTVPKSLNIIIRPSIWNTNLAYIIYTFLGAFLAYVIISFILKIQSLNYKVKIEQLEIDNVKEVNEAKLRFFSNISHEIKTPLTLISEPINMLLERFKGNPDIGEKLVLMERQSKKIHHLIEQVQDFRRSDVNALKMNYSRFSFNSFVEDIVEDFKLLAKNDNKNLEVIGEKSIIVVSGDKDKMEKIFNNLLSNAFKFTKASDTIKIKYKSDGKDLIVSIIDSGMGIDSIDLEHVFERFYQSHKQQNVHIQGSGIGLAFSKKLVEMHYGFIEATSTLNYGTTISIRLPIVRELLEKEVIEDIKLPKEKEIVVDNHFFKEASINDITTNGDFSEALIFYAEDNSEMRHFVAEILSKFFRIKSFRNGQECYDALEDEWPDIVISDVQMPELNGLDLCINIKSDLKTSHIPVILLTALTNIEDHLRGIRDGADAYIKKPFNVQHLVTNIEALLTNRKQLRERYQIGIPLTKENNKNNRNDNAFLEKLYSLIEENLDNHNFDLNNLTKELYLNRTHFYQKVKELTNQTPFELLKNYRLKKAGDYLLENKYSVNEVYMMTGFKSRTHFTKIFKEKFGVSPSKYEGESSATS